MVGASGWAVGLCVLQTARRPSPDHVPRPRGTDHAEDREAGLLPDAATAAGRWRPGTNGRPPTHGPGASPSRRPASSRRPPPAPPRRTAAPVGGAGCTGRLTPARHRTSTGPAPDHLVSDGEQGPPDTACQRACRGEAPMSWGSRPADWAMRGAGTPAVRSRRHRAWCRRRPEPSRAKPTTTSTTSSGRTRMTCGASRVPAPRRMTAASTGAHPGRGEHRRIRTPAGVLVAQQRAGSGRGPGGRADDGVLGLARLLLAPPARRARRRPSTAPFHLLQTPFETSRFRTRPEAAPVRPRARRARCGRPSPWPRPAGRRRRRGGPVRPGLPDCRTWTRSKKRSNSSRDRVTGHTVPRPRVQLRRSRGGLRLGGRTSPGTGRWRRPLHGRRRRR